MDSDKYQSKLRIFVSSPGDVAEERALTARVIKRLQDEFAPQCGIEPVFWEHEPLVATEAPQSQIVRPSETDIVICILWSRLGTRLSRSFTRSDGSSYQSGTEYEFEDALQGRKLRGIPDLLVYRKTAEPMASLQDEEALLEKLRQKKALSQFIDTWFRDQTDGTIVAAFHPFATSADFEEILEVHLRKLVQRRVPETSAPDRTSLVRRTWTKGSPFRGLHVFEFEDAPIFFGRTRAVSAVLDSLRKQAAKNTPFLMILGMSGCGKSSLVRAGVLPLLTEPQVIEGTREWRKAIFRPGDSNGDLIYGLLSALLQEGGLPELVRGTEVSEITRLFRENPEAARTLLTTTLKFLNGPAGGASLGGARLVLAIDPLEEIFSNDKVTPEERVNFVRILHALVRADCAWVIATLRSDFSLRCEELPELLTLGAGFGTFHLSPPATSEISQMVRRPAIEAGLRFETDPLTGFQLDDALIDSGAKDPNNLPLLEFTLDELYKQRTPDGVLTRAALQELGGVEGALARRADETFNSLSSAAQSAFSKVFASLVSVESAQQTVAVRKHPIFNMESESAAIKEFIDRFVTARLLVADRSDAGQPMFRVAHEALMRHWPKLTKWIEENREFLRARARVENAAQIWHEENESDDFLLAEGKPLAEAKELLALRSEDLSALEHRYIYGSIARAKVRRNRIRVLVGSLLGLIVAVSSSFGLFSFFQWRKAISANDRNREFTVTYFVQNGDIPRAVAILANIVSHGSDGASAARLRLQFLMKRLVSLPNNLQRKALPTVAYWNSLDYLLLENRTLVPLKYYPTVRWALDKSRGVLLLAGHDEIAAIQLPSTRRLFDLKIAVFPDVKGEKFFDPDKIYELPSGEWIVSGNAVTKTRREDGWDSYTRKILLISQSGSDYSEIAELPTSASELTKESDSIKLPDTLSEAAMWTQVSSTRSRGYAEARPENEPKVDFELRGSWRPIEMENDVGDGIELQDDQYTYDIFSEFGTHGGTYTFKKYNHDGGEVDSFTLNVEGDVHSPVADGKYVLIHNVQVAKPPGSDLLSFSEADPLDFFFSLESFKQDDGMSLIPMRNFLLNGSRTKMAVVYANGVTIYKPDNASMGFTEGWDLPDEYFDDSSGSDVTVKFTDDFHMLTLSGSKLTLFDCAKKKVLWSVGVAIPRGDKPLRLSSGAGPWATIYNGDSVQLFELSGGTIVSEAINLSTLADDTEVSASGLKFKREASEIQSLSIDNGTVTAVIHEGWAEVSTDEGSRVAPTLTLNRTFVRRGPASDSELNDLLVNPATYTGISPEDQDSRIAALELALQHRKW